MTKQSRMTTIWLLLFVLCCPFALLAQEQRATVRGIVRDEKGLALGYVNVAAKNNATGFTAGTQTDSTGVFRFAQLPAGSNYSFTFSYVGFETQTLSGYTLKPDAAFTLVVKMKTDTRTMDEVVVIGYGSQRRELLTSAIGSVKAKDFVKGAVTDAAQLIRGKVAGLSVITPDGNPTATSQLSLRGVNTINSGSNPLILIDGIPGNLTMVAPEDIEQIDVLKDGSAAAIYGTRGTNGVILITTKKAVKDLPPTIDINTYVTTQSISRRLKFMTPSQYRELVAAGKPGAQDFGASTNWLNEITQTPLSQVHSVTLRGGSKNTGYIASMEYRDMNGIVQNSNNKTFYPRLAVNHSMFDGMLKIDASILGYQQQYFAGTEDNASLIPNSYRGDVYRNALTYNPTDPVRAADGSWTQHTDKTDYVNPLSLLYETVGLNKNSDFRTYGTITFTPLSGLEFKLLGSHDVYNSLRGYYETKHHISTIRDGKNGYASRGTLQTREDQVDFTSQYNKDLKDHHFTVLGGFSWRKAFSESYYMNNWDFPTDFFSYNNMSTGKALSRGEATEGSNASESRLIGFFARVNYNFREKYLLMASMRREGSTRFGADHKWGSFPAISVGWNIKNEEFLTDSKLLSTLKVRAGYGITGTEPGSSYISLNKINFDSYTYINGEWIQVISPGNNPNPDLRWETKREFNAGIDFGFLNDRVSGSVDIYKRTTKDLIFDYPVPSPPYLFSTITANGATMENSGIEAALSASPIRNNKFQWVTSVNYSHNTNKIVSLSNDAFQLASGYSDQGSTGEPIQSTTHRIQVGQPVGNFYGYQSVGIDDNGHWMIRGSDGNAKPVAQQQPTDKRVIGNGLPRHYVNFNNAISYKKFDLSMTMRGAFGFQILNMAQMFYSAPVMLARGNVMQSTYDNLYGKRPLADDQSLQYVSYYIQKGNYWKIDNVTVGYNLALPYKNFKNMRIYAAVSNLATITGYAGIDPEVSIGGLAPGVDDRNRYPATRTYTFGAFFTF